MNRASRKLDQLQENAQPSAESIYSKAAMRSVARLPIFCPIVPAPIAPTTVTHRAIETVKPLAGSEGEPLRECMGGTGDDGSIKAEQQATERPGERAFRPLSSFEARDE
jgi:hypothetical protein